MSLFELFEFLFKFKLTMSDAATWIYIILVFVFFIFVLGFLWGRLWNKNWSLGGNPGVLGLVLIFGSLAAYAVFNFRATSQIEVS